MFLYNSVKRFFSNFFLGKASYKVAKRHRSPANLQECVDKPKRTRSCWKLIVLTILVLPSFYFMFYSETTNSFKAYKFRVAVNVTKSDKPGDYNLNEMKIIKEPKDPDEAIQTKSEKTKEEALKIKYYSTKKATKNNSLKESSLPPCNVSIVERVTVRKEVKKSINLDLLYSMVGMGGHYKPRDCQPKNKVAILVPYRNRTEHLKVFIYNIHPFLMRQGLEYRIFVFEQSGHAPFNKGRLFNAGFLEIQKNGDWECVIFHDIDLLPADGRILYTCPITPRHMCATVEGRENDLSYRTVFGGVTAMTMLQYRKVNGYSNLYWGWGAEDNDMSKRIRAAGMGVTTYKHTIGRYVPLGHKKRPKNPWRYDLLNKAVERYRNDGLNTLHYRMLSYASRPLYTKVVLDINPPVRPDYVTEAFKTYAF